MTCEIVVGIIALVGFIGTVGTWISKLSKTFGILENTIGILNRTIDEWISTETTTAYHASTFQHAINLTNLNVKGVIATGTFDVSYCQNLTHDSLMSTINYLKEGVTSKTVALGSTNLAKLSESEKAIATQKGWTLL